MAGILALAALGGLLSPRSGADPVPGNGLDPEKVAGPDSCGECHESEVEVWKHSQHATGFETLHRKDEAKALAKSLGLGRRFKNAAQCIRCHYTPSLQKGKPKSIAGISCESCHGVARDWIELHDKFESDSRETETSSQRAARIAKCESAGMFWPEKVYLLARNCYECHIVDDEEIVNAGHVAASKGFELVAWSQGEVRHNFAASEGQENRESPAPRRRVMFLAGLALDLEHSIRALAKATADGDYAKAMQARVETARAKLSEASDVGSDAQLQVMVTAADALAEGPWDPAQRADAEKVADRIQVALDAFAADNDGANLGALDPLLPQASEYRGRPHRGR